MTTLLFAVGVYTVAAILLSMVRKAIYDREAIEMAIVRQLKAQYEFHKRHAKR